MPNSVVHLTVCETCTDTTQSGEAGLGGGGKLLGLVEGLLSEHPHAEHINLQTQRCLMACTDGCVASVAAEGKMNYLLGRMPAEPDVAEQLLDFAALYHEAPTGVTPNHEWPPKIGSYFLGRIPPANPVDEEWAEEGSNL